MRRQFLACLALVTALLTLGVRPGWAADAALPDDVRIVPPAADVPADLRRFSGVWRGLWGGVMDHVLIVEQIAPSGEATLVYAWGDAPKWNIVRGWSRVEATIEGDEIDVDRFPNGAEADYTLEGPDSLSGDYWRRGYLTEGTFTRTSWPLPE